MTPGSRNLIALGLVLGLIGAAGCLSESTVSGEVTLDGQPLKEGVITFVPADGKSQTASAAIVDGRFSATVPPGEKKVEISAPKVIGKIKMIDAAQGKEVDEVVELLPACYNVRTELTMMVQNGSQQKRFDLKSK
jgi:hypothetical protein